MHYISRIRIAGVEDLLVPWKMDPRSSRLMVYLAQCSDSAAKDTGPVSESQTIWLMTLSAMMPNHHRRLCKCGLMLNGLWMRFREITRCSLLQRRFLWHLIYTPYSLALELRHNRLYIEAHLGECHHRHDFGKKCSGVPVLQSLKQVMLAISDVFYTGLTNQ